MVKESNLSPLSPGDKPIWTAGPEGGKLSCPVWYYMVNMAGRNQPGRRKNVNSCPRNAAMLLAALAVAFGAIGCGRPAGEEAALSGKAPDFELENFAGGKTRLADYRGKVVLLNFWATWCGPCVAEAPDFVDLYKKHREKGLVILGVSLDQNPRAILYPFIRRHKIDYPILLGDRRVAAAYGGITGIPTTFLIDREGMVRKQYLGSRPKSVFEEDIKELL